MSISRSKIAFIVSYAFFHGLWFAIPSNLRRNTNAFHTFPNIMVFLHRLISHRLRGVLLKIAQITEKFDSI